MKTKLLFLLSFLFSVFSYSQGGSLDTTFDIGSGPNDRVEAIAIQANGKIIIAGFFTSYNGTARNYIARLNSNGSLDTTFNTGAGANGGIKTITLQPDGKIIIGGYFTSYNGVNRNRIARLNTNGNLDTTFNPGAGADSEVLTTAIQADGKIIIGGSFLNFNTINRTRVVRLNTNGSLDTTFNPYPLRIGADNAVFSSVIQADGKIIIGGNFTRYNGDVRNKLARLNQADGSLDLSFAPEAGTSTPVKTIAIQSDNTILIGGNFNTYYGITRRKIARLFVWAGLDTAFNAAQGPSSFVDKIAIQTNGKIIIVGDFTAYDGIGRSRIARLNPDSSLDTSFNPGAGANAEILTAAIQTDGKILIGGYFTTYDTIGRNFLARVNITGFLLDEDFSMAKSLKLYPNPVESVVHIDTKNLTNVSLEVIDSYGRVLQTHLLKNTNNISLENLKHGIYLFKIYSNEGSYTTKVIKE